PVPLQLFYRYNAMKGGPMPEVGYDGLYKAFSILPQHSEYRVDLAQALAGKGEYEKASRLLNPLIYSPHGSEERDAMVKLKAEYDAKAKTKAAGRAGSD
ncbi:MAG TPA: hypothetical protein VF442_09405, partial [Sphingobium sp.]